MATKLDAEAYKYFKSLPESEWTNEERRAINDYERAEAQAPSNDELEFANFVINKSSKNTFWKVFSCTFYKTRSHIFRNLLMG